LSSYRPATGFVLFQFPGDLTPLTDSSKGLRFEKVHASKRFTLPSRRGTRFDVVRLLVDVVYASVTTWDSFRRILPARRRRSSFVRSSKSFVTSPRPPRPRSTLAGGHRHECIRAGPPAGVALPKSIAEPYPAQTSIHPLSDDFPRLIGRGPGDGRYRDRAEPAEMSVHPRGVGQSHPDPSLQHQASQVPTNGERFRATPNLVRQIVAAESRAQRSVFSVIRLDSRIRWARSVVRCATGADRGLERRRRELR